LEGFWARERTIAGGVLTPPGTATGDDFTATITAWSTTVSGNTMSGTVDYSLTMRGIPGVAGIRSRLDRVTRETTSARTNTSKPIRLRGAR
jgi:FlaG/FlaF family flagellin (archaellin)